MENSIWNVNFHKFNSLILKHLFAERFTVCDYTLIYNGIFYHRIILNLVLWDYEIMVSNCGVLFVSKNKIVQHFQTFSITNFSGFLESYNKVIEYFEELEQS